jgi:subtilase family serine protease
LVLGASAAWAQAKPDLVVTEIGCDPYYSRVTFKVQNRSNVPLPKGWRAVADLYFDGVKKAFYDLGPATSGSLTPAGGTAYYLTSTDIVAPVAAKVVADSTNDIDEANETNNSMTVKLAPCGEKKLPDLTVAIKGPASAAPGQNIGPLISLTVSNVGAADAPGTSTAGSGYMVDIVLSSDGALPVAAAVTSPAFAEDMLLTGGRVSVTSSLAPGASKTYSLAGGAGVSLPTAIKPGKYCLGAVVDPMKAVTEKREDNNTSCWPLVIK